MFRKNKLQKTVTFLAPAGAINLVFPLDFRPKELTPAFVLENHQSFPACHPIPSDTLSAEIVRYGEDEDIWAIKVTGQIAGDRLIRVIAKNYIG